MPEGTTTNFIVKKYQKVVALLQKSLASLDIWEKRFLLVADDENCCGSDKFLLAALRSTEEVSAAAAARDEGEEGNPAVEDPFASLYPLTFEVKQLTSAFRRNKIGSALRQLTITHKDASLVDVMARQQELWDQKKAVAAAQPPMPAEADEASQVP